jgi:hypothetical protein
MSSMLRARLLTVVMLLMGILMVVGGTISVMPTSLLPFDGLAGSDASVAGVALGVGIAAASFNPEGHVSWVRIAILYSILEIVYRVIFGLFWGAWGTGVPMVLAVIFGIVLVVLYPRRGELMPHSGTTETTAPAGAH